jgi:putative FmdB family regulatory protein
MPTYEYQCDACGHEFEREQRITEDPIKTCPECGARKARRLISRTSFVLKGGGWYSDLYSGPTARKDAAKSEGEAKSEPKGDASGDAKPAPASSTGSDAAASPASGSAGKRKSRSAA